MPPPRGGGALLRNLSDKNGLFSASNNAENLTPQEQLLNGTLELDPANDPVIYTTDYGLDIKWHMVGLPANSADITILESGVKFAGYAYFTHADVNWVIIGCSNKTYTLLGVINLSPFINYYSEYSNSSLNMLQIQDSDAATEIYDAHINGFATFFGDSSTAKIKSALFPNAVSSSELETNEILCFAQNSFNTTSKFNDSTSAGNCYYNSRLMSTMNDFYNNNLTDLPIAEKTLKTVWRGASDTTNGSDLPETYKIFPLAGKNANESFYVLNYLSSGSDAMKQSSWWLRSGNASDSLHAYYVNSNGSVSYGLYNNDRVNASYGVRPAFVLKL